MRMHVVSDLSTGKSVVRDRLGRDHTFEEVQEARRRAAAGDPAAQALVEIVSLGDDDATAAAATRELIDQCPECAALRARGEQPIVWTGEDLHEMQRAMPPRWSRPRWRDVKRRAR